jgi:hypothetical protein
MARLAKHMALLLLLVWREWMNGEGHMIVDDEIPATQSFGRVPAYAIDQFTRIGGSVARAYLAASSAMRNIMDEACFPAGKRPRAVGDLMFLLEGSAMSRRTIWPLGERLRQPVRMLAIIRNGRDYFCARRSMSCEAKKAPRSPIFVSNTSMGQWERPTDGFLCRVRRPVVWYATLVHNLATHEQGY